MNNLDARYQALLEDILHWGVEKTDRTGTGTISVFGRQIRHKMSEGFPLLTTKKMAWKTMVTELLWFLRGDTNIKYLVDNGCHIWDGDAYKRYRTEWSKATPGDGTFSSNEYKSPTEYEACNFTQEEFINKIKTDDEFANKWGELGPIYGKQWRSWHWRSEPVLPEEKDMIYTTEGKPVTWSEEKYIDQIANSINLLKTDPDSRRNRVNAWNVGELDQMVLPPCHTDFQFYTRELSWDERHELAEKVYQIDDTDDVLDKEGVPTRAISLMYNTRSQDVPLGTPFNIASYALLLMMIAKQVNMIPDELIANMGDCHIYLNQIEGVKEQITRVPYELPTVKISDRVVNDISEYTLDDITLENYQYHPSIKMPLSN